jgi:hypothetical protein
MTSQMLVLAIAKNKKAAISLKPIAALIPLRPRDLDQNFLSTWLVLTAFV